MLCLTVSNVQVSLMKHSASCSKTKKTGTVGIIMHTKRLLLMERSKLVATTEHLTKVKSLLSNTGIIELCARNEPTQNGNLQADNCYIFAALLKDVPVGCKDTVLPDPLLKTSSVKCLIFEENTRKPYNDNLCLFRAFALHFHGNERLEEETSKLAVLLFATTGGTDPANFRGVCMEDKDIAAVEDIVQAGFFLYDFEVVDESMAGKLGRRSVGKHSNTVRLLRYNSHIVMSPISMLSSKPIVVHRVMTL